MGQSGHGQSFFSAKACARHLEMDFIGQQTVDVKSTIELLMEIPKTD